MIVEGKGMNNTAMDQAEFLTTAEVAKTMRVTPTCVAAWIRDGRLRASRFGRRWLISRSDAEAILRGGYTEDVCR